MSAISIDPRIAIRLSPAALPATEELPRNRQPYGGGPLCPACGRHYLAGSTRPSITYYYPRCGCPEAEPEKVRRPVDVDRLPERLHSLARTMLAG